MTTQKIHQTYFFKATPEQVYNLIVDEELHSAFTGSHAEINNVVGDDFNAWDGYIEGKNLEIIPNQKIVQLWRSQENDWPEDHFSTATFVFEPKNGGTELTFDQIDVPTECIDNITQGWIDYYWRPMEEYLAKNLEE